MPRPKKRRLVCQRPFVSCFMPKPLNFTYTPEEIVLPVEGFEAIRLVDFEGMDQETAADAMHVSRPTLGRILGEARAIIAEAIVTGKILRIAGGSYELCPIDWCPKRHRHRFRGCKCW